MPRIFWKPRATHIKLMVDYTFGKKYADELNKLGAVKAKAIIDYGFRSDAKDCDLVSATNEHGCILLTGDNKTINETIYKPCTHGGIIIIKKARPFPQDVVACVKAFCESGKRSLAKHGVTHLYHDRAVIHTHSDDPETVRF